MTSKYILLVLSNTRVICCKTIYWYKFDITVVDAVNGQVTPKKNGEGLSNSGAHKADYPSRPICKQIVDSSHG
jgi:hypothetical protein